MEEAFPEISLHNDLGIYTWLPGTPGEIQPKRHQDVSVDDILSRFPDEPPDPDDPADALRMPTLVDRTAPVINYSGIRLPLRFRDTSELPAQEYPSEFPYTPGYIVPLFVVVSRGLLMEEIDFVLGGSSLSVLADCSTHECLYLVQKVQNVIFIGKSDPYVANYADRGFQFERLVTGGQMEGTHDIVKHESVRVVKVGPFRVLFAAEVDAVDDAGYRVEIKSGNPRYFGTKLLLQMLSSGAQSLVYLLSTPKKEARPWFAYAAAASTTSSAITWSESFNSCSRKSYAGWQICMR